MKFNVHLLLLLVASGCTTTNPGVEGTQSLRVELVSPTDTGSPTEPLDDSERTIAIRVTALDEQGEVDVNLDRVVDVHAQFLGGLTPALGRPPLTTVQLINGESIATTVELPPVYGATYLWVEDGDNSDGEATYATGTSPTLWYRNPSVEDIQRPLNEMALSALDSSPLQDKQVSVPGSRYGEKGRLVVTSTYAQGYTLSDVECQDAAGTPPCVAGDYDHLLIFTFSRPRDDDGDDIFVGQSIDGFAGAVQEFNGLTELGFPQTFAAGALDIDVERLPDPVVVDSSWFADPIRFERNESGLLDIPAGTICPLDDNYVTYKQWKLDIGSGCGTSSISVITSGTITDFDPAAYVGQEIPSVIGTLRPVNIGTFNVWILFPRFAADLVLP